MCYELSVDDHIDKQEGRLGPAVDLYWIPLSVGVYVARFRGKLFEALRALVEHRPRLDLYHTALQIRLPEERFVIECAAILNLRGEERGVVAEGAIHWASIASSLRLH